MLFTEQSRLRTLLVALGIFFSLAGAGQETKRPYSSAAQPRRVPEPGQGPAALLGKTMDADGKLLARVRVALTPSGNGKPVEGRSAADGIVRIPEVEPGKYQIVFELSGFQAFTQPEVVFNPGEALMIAVKLRAGGPSVSPAVAEAQAAGGEPGQFRELSRQPVRDLSDIFSPEVYPDTKLMAQDPDRWDTTMP